MNHRQAREHLPLYADGELDPQRTAELKEQLARSAELRDELERWRALRHCAHRVVTAPAVPTELGNTIRDDLRRRERAARRRPLWAFGGVTAIAATIVLLIVLWPSGMASAKPVLVSADKFAEVYLCCAVERRHRAVEVDLDDLDAAHTTLANLKTYPVLLPDLQDRGFQLDGVCECFHVEGVRVVHAFYRQGDPESAVVSFFSVDQKVCLSNCRTCPSRVKLRQEYETARFEDVAVCKWDEAANSFAVCGRIEPEQLRELADGVRVASLVESVPVLAQAY